MIKWGPVKYQYYGSDGPEVVFDVERDPSETVDFLEDPGYAAILARFRRRRVELGHGPPPPIA